MIRNIVHIDEEKCTGCGLCAEACHEGAIGMVGGKARLLRDDYCDGLGDCLPACPADAISIIQREAEAYDEAAVIANQMAQAKMKAHAGMPATGCPGSMAKTIERAASWKAWTPRTAHPSPPRTTLPQSSLRVWGNGPCRSSSLPSTRPTSRERIC